MSPLRARKSHRKARPPATLRVANDNCQIAKRHEK
jgi:hypothetical protein